jgi:DNA-binding MarR family transcriptional regulator
LSQQRQGGFLVAKIHRTAGRIFARKLREHGLVINPAQGRVLFVLWQEGAMAINELAKRVSLGKSTLTNTIDGLEAAGLVARSRDAGDRRKILVEPTAENRTMHRLYEKVSLQMTEVFYRGFTVEEVTRFEAGLERILQNVSTEEKAQ